jgi:hypothetical protein
MMLIIRNLPDPATRDDCPCAMRAREGCCYAGSEAGGADSRGTKAMEVEAWNGKHGIPAPKLEAPGGGEPGDCLPHIAALMQAAAPQAARCIMSGDLPDRQRLQKPVQPPCEKYSSFFFSEIVHTPCIPFPLRRGVSRSSRTWEAGCDGRALLQRDLHADER